MKLTATIDKITLKRSTAYIVITKDAGYTDVTVFDNQDAAQRYASFAEGYHQRVMIKMAPVYSKAED